MLKFLKYQLDNTTPLRRSAHDGLVLDPESATRGFRVTDPPLKKQGFVFQDHIGGFSTK
jgi:hypothetical protein